VATTNILAGGILSGIGTIAGNVNNTAGTVAPGTSPGILTINGNYVQGSGGTLAVEIGGTAAGTQYDQLIVTGNATLGGALGVALIGGFVPPSGSTFAVVQAGAVNGAFSITPTALGAAAVTTNYLPSSVNVVTAAAITDQITNTQNQSTQIAPPTSNIVFNSNSTSSSGGSIPTVYLETTSGQIVPLTPMPTFQSGAYVNLDTGQSIFLTSDIVPTPGVYFNEATQTIMVVTVDPVTGQIQIMSGSSATTQVAVEGGAQVRRPAACK
jgi:hypothetical protein